MGDAAAGSAQIHAAIGDVAAAVVTATDGAEQTNIAATELARLAGDL